MLIPGNPWVKISDPYPYPASPYPSNRGPGFGGYGSGVARVLGVWKPLRVLTIIPVDDKTLTLYVVVNIIQS